MELTLRYSPEYRDIETEQGEVITDLEYYIINFIKSNNIKAEELSINIITVKE